MPDYLYYPIAGLIGYLLGSLNGSLLVSHLIMKDDIRRHGSGNAGATNVLRTYGKGWTVAVSVWDMGKGALAMLCVWLLMNPAGLGEIGRVIAGIAVIIGHVFPVFFGFKGGKGVITACMVMLLLDWQTACIALAFFLTLVIITRYISLGSIVAVTVLPIAMLALNRPIEKMIASLIILVLVLFLHRANIKRLLNGTENKFGSKKKE